MTDRPNILFIMADQLTAFALRAYGNRVCRTPNLDALAARGTVFEHCYCNFPVCAPSRASLLTGRLASRLGVYDNACEFPSSAPTIAYYMSALGYHTSLAGKMHFVGPDQLHGYQERLTTDIYPSDFGWTPDWRHMVPVAATGLNLRSVVESGTCRRSLQLDYDDEVAARAVQRIYDYGRSPQERPFFFTVSFTHPHNPYVITEDYWNRYDPARIDAPRVPPLPPDRHDPHSRRLRDIYRFDEYRVSPEDVLRSRHAYYAMISYVDDQVGRLLQALRDMDLEDDTVVVFTSDHGDMLGERGLWYKWTLFEGAVRIPLIAAAPGQRPFRVATPVSLLDLLPTFIDLGGAAGRGLRPVSETEGRSLAPCLAGGPAPAPRPVFAEMTADGAVRPCLMVRKGPWKYIHCESDPPQLFQLERDPVEVENLAGGREAAAIEAELRALVAAHWDEAGLAREMQASAARRLFIQQTRQAGRFEPWDYEPRKDPSRQFVRSGENGSATTVKGRARYPFVAPKPPDNPR
ncbi:choline-sulfatase [Pigmentiphaga soli]|uniref:Choline-sulfatase n=1 Tax=Pigmentiphaga soli TaxID=1007095 RepID=A0ABP8GVD0_9BURK